MSYLNERYKYHAQAREEYPDDRRRYAVRLCQLLCTDVNILVPGGAVVPSAYGKQPPQLCTAEEVFRPADLQIIRALQARYGEDAVVGSVCFYDDYTYPLLYVFHEDILGTLYDDTTLARLRFNELDDIHLLSHNPCRLLEPGSSFASLAQRLNYTNHPELQELIRDTLHPVTYEGPVAVIPVLPAMHGETPFEDCPDFGTKLSFDDPNQLTEGVVVHLAGMGRVRIQLQWKHLDDGGWFRGRAEDLKLRIEETSDPLTPTGTHRGPVGTRYLTVRGPGRSQQSRAAAFCGKLPRCLLHFKAGTDFLWCLMVTLDDDGKIRAGWFEGSAT